MENFLTLDGKAALLAVIVGTLILYFGRLYGPFFLAVILLFLALSAVVTNIGRKRKKRLGLYEVSRGWKNVIANGMVPLLIAIGFWLYGSDANIIVFMIVYIASVAGTTADKFASELGVLDGMPRSIIGFLKVKRGVSGGITAFGALASLIGAALIGLSALSLGLGYHYIAIIAFSGFLGGIVDSFTGYFEEKGIGNKFTSNILCAVASSLIAYALLI